MTGVTMLVTAFLGSNLSDTTQFELVSSNAGGHGMEAMVRRNG